MDVTPAEWRSPPRLRRSERPPCPSSDASSGPAGSRRRTRWSSPTTWSIGLTAAGVPLPAAVDAALRRNLEAERRAAEAEMRGEKIPFWLRREGGGSGEMEDALRDRIAQRRGAEEDR